VKRLARAVYASLPLKRQVYTFIRHRLGIVPSFYQHLHFKGRFELGIDAEHKINLFSAGNIVENELFWRGFGGTWEAMSLRLWKRICERSSGAILDIGANSGIYALVAAKLAPSAQVIAFEPIARVANQLRHNVELNALSIRVEECAVSDRDGTVPIYDLPVAFNYSASIEGQGPAARRTEVPVCSIDKFLSSHDRPPVTAIKIDVERHEAAAVAGMKRTLTHDRPAILIEILDETIGEAVAEHVAGLGYLMFQIAEDQGIIPSDRLAPLGGHDWNHLLCTPDQFERLNLTDFLAR
jgi:FkbM family methyltransferase